MKPNMTGDCDSLGTTRADRTLASLTLTAALIAAFGFSVDARAPGCVQPLPNGFHQLKDAGLRDPWDKPWALRRTPSGTSSLPVLRHSSRDAARPMPLRLDDGTTGTLVVVAKDCQLGGDCSPYDCGCTGPTEGYWIEVHRADGTVIARRHLWAAYQAFQIALVDVDGGVGDELIVTRISAHASPSIGWDLEIWELRGGREFISLGGMPKLTYPLPGPPYGSAWWIGRLIVNANRSKPRTIDVRTDFGFVQGCHALAAADKTRVAQLRLAHSLRFDRSAGRYVLRGPAPSAFSAE
jgi:hypothetical protein